MESLTDDFVKISTEYSMSNESLKKLFIKESTFLKHYEALQSSYGNYASVLVILLSQKMELSLGTKSRILAACWATKNVELVDYLINGLRQVNGLDNSNIVFGFAEILKALNLLDSRRKIVQLEKKLKRLEGNPKVNPLTVSTIKSKLNELKNEPVPYGSVSGALSRNIISWVSSLSPSILEYYALTLPKEPWMELANLIHLNPKQLQLPWFLDYVYDKEIPADTVVKECQKIFYKEEAEILHLLGKWKIPYSFLRRQLQGTLANSDGAYHMPTAAASHGKRREMVVSEEMKELKRTRKYQSTGNDCGLTEIVFAFDTTGSMSAAIEQVEKKVTETMTRLYRDSPSIRIGLVAHGDYCDGVEKSYQMMDFVGDGGIDTLTNWVNQKIRTGGGDAPECYELVLKYVHSKFSWTEGSRRILVMIGDDKPHSPKESLAQQKTYGFPNPIAIDYVVELDECWKKGIVIYSVGVPSNNSFHVEMSARTCGTHLDMSGFDSTTDMILAICFKESNGGKHYDAFLKEVQAEGRMTETMERMFQRLDGGEDDEFLIPGPTPRRGGSRGRGSSRGRGASRGRGGSRGRGASRGRGGSFRGRSASRGRGGKSTREKKPESASEEVKVPSTEDPKSEAPKPEVKEKEPEIPKFRSLTNSMKEMVATYSPIDTLIWFHEELQCPEVNLILQKRLKEGEEPTFGYGKLMERILYIKSKGYSFLEDLIPIAEKRLTSLSLPLERPVVVCGDASRSMQVAVKTATIISSLLTVLTSAELRFFKDENCMPPVQPRTIREVLRVAEEVKADGGTVPASCLYESYKNKEVVKYFVLVTDEEENGTTEDMTFVELFKKYREEVYADSKLVFISFLSDPKEKGQMMTELEKEEITPMQFKLNVIKPDLTKMDAFLALLSSESKEFNQQTEEFSKLLKEGTPLYQLLKKLHSGKEILSTYRKKQKKADGKEEVPIEGDGKGSCLVS